jgi:hypothetical protein
MNPPLYRTNSRQFKKKHLYVGPASSCLLRECSPTPRCFSDQNNNNNILLFNANNIKMLNTIQFLTLFTKSMLVEKKKKKKSMFEFLPCLRILKNKNKNCERWHLTH